MKLFAKKCKRIVNPNKISEDIHSESRDGIWYRKICHSNYEKQKSEMTEGIELPNQGIIRKHREKETYKNLGILEVETIIQVKMTEKI